jgi:hypothetical protein
VVGGVQVFFRQPDDEVVGVPGLAVVGGQQPAGRDHEDQAEDVERPAPRLQHRLAEGDEDRPGQQREDDAEQQHLLLVLAWHSERAHDHQEHEQVVDAEGFLQQPAVEILRAHVDAAEYGHGDTEEDSQAHVDDRPEGGFFEGGCVCLADVEEEVEGEQPHDDCDGQDPDPKGDGQPVSLLDIDRGGGRGPIRK